MALEKLPTKEPLSLAEAIETASRAGIYDAIIRTKDSNGWRVIYLGVLQRPSFNFPGAASAFLSGLINRTRNPEPVL